MLTFQLNDPWTMVYVSTPLEPLISFKLDYEDKRSESQNDKYWVAYRVMTLHTTTKAQLGFLCDE